MLKQLKSITEEIREEIGFDTCDFTFNPKDELTEFEGCKIVSYPSSMVDFRAIGPMKGKPSRYNAYIDLSFVLIFSESHDFEAVYSNFVSFAPVNIQSAELRREVIKDEFKINNYDMQLIKFNASVFCPTELSTCLKEMCKEC